MAGQVWDAPNQQVVRGDQSAPWEEGNGGSPAPEPQQQEAPPEPTGAPQTYTAEELDLMTKEELLAYGQSLGISPMNAAMTKQEIRDGIDAYQAA